MRSFKRHHYIITHRNGQELENINPTLKEIINPANLYGIYFHNKDIEPKFTSLCSTLFDKNIKFVKYNTVCKDLEQADKQNEAIKEYHYNNHNGITNM